jgi:predicted MFS family arabinose efflux permease
VVGRNLWAVHDPIRDRRALQSVATQFFVNGAVFASFIPRLPEIRDQLGIRLSTLGLLLTGAGAFGIVGSAAVGPLVERVGTRRLIIGGGIALVACLPLIGFAVHPVVLLLGLAGLSAIDVLVDVAMNMQGSWLSARRARPVMNRLHGLWSLGTVVGGLSAARLAAAGVSIRIHLMLAALVLLGAIAFVGRGLLTVDEAPNDPVPSATIEDPGRRRRAYRLGLWAFAVAGATAVTIESTSSDWAAFRLTDDFGAAAGIAGLAYVANTTGMTIGRFIGDAIESAVGRHRHLDLAIGLTAVGLTLASFAPNRWLSIVGYLLTGLGVAPYMPRLYDDAVKFPGRPGAGLARLTGGIRISVLITPAIVGALAATSLGVGAATAMVTLPALAAFTAISLTRRQMATRTEPIG